ncbi:hypothetical protein [Krasilnikovia sp. MM14-A1259]|uniref:hypothetical protein n=1 Tax=Krasilnikovia sp. MM14-A1259 TaxID=3373539 RepID=UPI003823FD44
MAGVVSAVPVWRRQRLIGGGPTSHSNPACERLYVPDSFDDRLARLGPVAAQLAAVYVLGCLTLPVAAALFVVLIFGGGFGLLVVPVAAVGLIFLAGTVTSDASPATSTAARRFWWAVAVTTGGMVGVGGVAWLTTVFDMKYGEMAPWTLAAGLPYVAVAALFIGRRIRVTVLAVVLILGVGAGMAVHGQFRRQHTEDRRADLMSLLRAPLDQIYTTEIPGYRPTATPVTATTEYEPSDQATVKYWREQSIVLTVSHTAVQGPDCGPDVLCVPQPPPVLRATDAPADGPEPVQPTAPPPRPEEITCRPDGSSLLYRRGRGAHEYIRTDGNTVLRAGAGIVVDKALLKTAVLAARPVGEDELETELLGR